MNIYLHYNNIKIYLNITFKKKVMSKMQLLKNLQQNGAKRQGKRGVPAMQH